MIEENIASECIRTVARTCGCKILHLCDKMRTCTEYDAIAFTDVLRPGETMYVKTSSEFNQLAE